MSKASERKTITVDVSLVSLRVANDGIELAYEVPQPRRISDPVTSGYAAFLVDGTPAKTDLNQYIGRYRLTLEPIDD